MKTILGVALSLLVLANMSLAREPPMAKLEIGIYSSNEAGEYQSVFEEQIHGYFSSAGTLASAEGDLLQIHPLGLCDSLDYDDHYKYGWIGVVKIERPSVIQEPVFCATLYQKAKRAIQRGAIAIVFIVNDNLGAAEELESIAKPVDMPIVLVRNKSEADKLVKAVKLKHYARGRIVSSRTQSPQASKPTDGDGPQITSGHINTAIFLGVFLVLCVVCIALVLRFRLRQQHVQTQAARRLVNQLGTVRHRSGNSANSEQWAQRATTDDDTLDERDCQEESCAVCLEVYRDGEELRLLPCGHKYHRKCVDPWLIANFTCPCCCHNIADLCNKSMSLLVHDQQKPSDDAGPNSHRGQYSGSGYYPRDDPDPPSCYEAGDGGGCSDATIADHNDSIVLATGQSRCRLRRGGSAAAAAAAGCPAREGSGSCECSADHHHGEASSAARECCRRPLPRGAPHLSAPADESCLVRHPSYGRGGAEVKTASCGGGALVHRSCSAADRRQLVPPPPQTMSTSASAASPQPSASLSGCCQYAQLEYLRQKLEEISQQRPSASRGSTSSTVSSGDGDAAVSCSLSDGEQQQQQHCRSGRQTVGSRRVAVRELELCRGGAGSCRGGAPKRQQQLRPLSPALLPPLIQQLQPPDFSLPQQHSPSSSTSSSSSLAGVHCCASPSSSSSSSSSSPTAALAAPLAMDAGEPSLMAMSMSAYSPAVTSAPLPSREIALLAAAMAAAAAASHGSHVCLHGAASCWQHSLPRTRSECSFIGESYEESFDRCLVAAAAVAASPPTARAPARRSAATDSDSTTHSVESKDMSPRVSDADGSDDCFVNPSNSRAAARAASNRPTTGRGGGDVDDVDAVPRPSAAAAATASVDAAAAVAAAAAELCATCGVAHTLPGVLVYHRPKAAAAASAARGHHRCRQQQQQQSLSSQPLQSRHGKQRSKPRVTFRVPLADDVESQLDDFAAPEGEEEEEDLLSVVLRRSTVPAAVEGCVCSRCGAGRRHRDSGDADRQPTARHGKVEGFLSRCKSQLGNQPVKV